MAFSNAVCLKMSSEIITTVTQKQFNEAIPASLRPYIHVASQPLPATLRGVLNAFQVAVECLDKKIRVVRPLEVIVARAPFDLTLGNGSLRYTPHNDQVINVHIDDRLVLLDAEKMGRYEKEVQVALILE